MGELVILGRYIGSGVLVLWFFVALVFIYLKEEKKPARITFLYLPVLLLILFLNPLFYRFFYKAVGEEIYFRILWLLPITVVDAYGIILVYGLLKEKKRRFFLGAAIVTIAMSGTLVYTNPLFTPAQNLYHVPKEVVKICDAIVLPGREVMAAFPDELLLYVRQYTPYVCMPYGRDYLMGENPDELAILLEEERIPLADLARLSRERQCHYIILKNDKVLVGNYSAFAYQLYMEVGDYMVFRDVTMNFDLTMPTAE